MNPELSLQEVWRWKDSLSDILKNLSLQERLEYFRRTDEEESKKNRQTAPSTSCWRQECNFLKVI